MPPGDAGAREAHRLARHLIGEDPLPEEVQRYLRAIEVRGATLERPRDARLWQLMMRRPWLIGVVDAGLALTDADSPIRQRLCLMLAVLEASPAHCRRFLPAPYPVTALAGLSLRMAAAALRSALGLVLVRTWGLLWR